MISSEEEDGGVRSKQFFVFFSAKIARPFFLDLARRLHFAFCFEGEKQTKTKTKKNEN